FIIFKPRCRMMVGLFVSLVQILLQVVLLCYLKSFFIVNGFHVHFPSGAEFDVPSPETTSKRFGFFVVLTPNT
ncbi:MAG: hypothetical protein PF486_09645, partial [Prolixibacteraceae bacterium]|nr:hypothetical protein [Prolixibacteraceae bacterium]